MGAYIRIFLIVLGGILAGACERETKISAAQQHVSVDASEPTPMRRPQAETQPARESGVKPQPGGEKVLEQQERARLKSEFEELSSKIAELRERANTLTSSRTRERVAAAVSDLEQKRRAVAQELEHWDDWRTSASLAWQDMRDGLIRAMEELCQAYDKAKQHF